MRESSEFLFYADRSRDTEHSRFFLGQIIETDGSRFIYPCRVRRAVVADPETDVRELVRVRTWSARGKGAAPPS